VEQLRDLGGEFRGPSGEVERSAFVGLSAHLDTLYASLPALQRYAAAADHGFQCVEIWSAPRPEEVDATVAALERHSLSLASVNAGCGSSPDSFGVLGDPDAVQWWRNDFVRTLEFARRCDAGAINLLIGGRQEGATRPEQLSCITRNLDWALSQVGSVGPVLLLEPLNGVDRCSPLVRDVSDALSVMSDLGDPAQLRLLFDAYHLFQEEPDLGEALQRASGVIGHIQIADYPGRGEPGTGVIDFPTFINDVRQSGYDGWLGLEYFGSGPAEVGTAWLQGIAPPPGDPR